MRKFLVVAPLLLSSLITFSQKHDNILTARIQKLLQGFHGDVAVYVKDLRTGKTVDISADSLFPTASLVKIPILIGIINKISRGEVDYHQNFIYSDTMMIKGVDILGSFKNGEKIELSKLIMLMLTMSDNTASYWIQSIAGSGTAINSILDTLGFHSTRVNSKVPGREEFRAKYGWGQTTPREIVSLLEKIYHHQVISAGACDRMLRSLNRNYWDAEAVSQIPPYVGCFSKNGALETYRSQVMLVKGMKCNYAFSIFCNNITDTSWVPTNEAWVLMRKLSRLLWKYFEPSDKWEPAPDAEKYD